MKLNLTEGDWKTWTVVCAIVVSQFLFEHWLVRCKAMQVKITLDVLDNMKNVDYAKDTIRNIFTNLAIVGALIMTIAFAMLFLGDHLEDLTEDEDDELKWLLAHAFAAATGYACLQSARSMIEAVINLIYTEALSSPETIRFLIAGPGAIGAPVMAIGFSLISILIASAVWLFMMYSMAAGTLFSIFAIRQVIGLLYFIDKRSKFDTDRTSKRSVKWIWAETNGDPPKMISGKCTDKEIVMMRERALAAIQCEKEHEQEASASPPRKSQGDDSKEDAGGVPGEVYQTGRV